MKPFTLSRKLLLAMTLRRCLALAIFLLSAFALIFGVRLFRSASGGYDLYPGLIVSGIGLLGILVAIAIAFGHRDNSVSEDRGSGLVPERAKPGIAAAISELFGLAMWFIACRGLVRNRMEAVGATPAQGAWRSPGSWHGHRKKIESPE